MEISLQTIEEVLGIIVALGTCWAFVRKILKDLKKSRKEEAEGIIKQAREEDSFMRIKLEARLETLKTELRNLEFNVNKDFQHVKESHSNEIKALGEKIEAIREQLNSQHSQLLEFLTKLVSK
jgi:septal ring factor EnvC (AmiA/AmiB activator)